MGVCGHCGCVGVFMSTIAHLGLFCSAEGHNSISSVPDSITASCDPVVGVCVGVWVLYVQHCAPGVVLLYLELEQYLT